MGLPREGGNGGDGEARRDAGGASEERASSSSDASSSYGERESSRKRPSSAEDGGGAGEPGRIPAAVFERDPAEPNKDWSMMSTDSVFALQVAPSSDFTGFFLAHPELMDLAASTTPRASSVAAADERAHSTQFDSIPELGEATMQLQGHYSFAFPTLIEVKRHSSKNPQEVHPMAAPTTMVAVAAAAEPAPAPAKAEMSSKPEEAPRKVASKGGWLPCFPCC